MAHKSNNKVFNADELKTVQVGVHQDPSGPGPLSYVDVSGDVFANQYQFGINEVDSALSISIDFDNDIVQTIELDNDVVFTTANRASLSDRLKAATVKIKAINGNRKLTFDNAIRFLGNIPTGLEQDKIGIVSFNSFGPNETDTVAVYRTEGEYLVGIPEPAVLFNRENQITGEACFTYDTNENELHVGGHILPCTQESVAGSFDLGSSSEYWRSLYLAGKEITIDNVNAKYYVPRDTDAVAGNHAALPAGAQNTGSYTDYDNFISKEIILTTKEIDFGYTGEHIINLPTSPSDKTFYVDEIGIVITHTNSIPSDGSGGISVKFGYENTGRTETEALMDEIYIETPLELYDRERFMTPKNSCGITNNLMATITTGVKEYNISRELYGRFYYKGIFIENEY